MNDNEPQCKAITLTEKEIADIRTMIQWWKFSRNEPSEIRRPKFKRGSETQCITLRLPKELVQDAKKYASNNLDVSKGSINGLVEFLLWHCLGCSDKYVSSPRLSHEEE